MKLVDIIEQIITYIVFKFDKFIFITILYFSKILDFSVDYLMWRKQYMLLAGFLEGYFSVSGLNDDDYCFLDDIYTELCNRREWYAAAFVGALMNSAFPRACYDQAILAGNLCQAQEISRKFNLRLATARH